METPPLVVPLVISKGPEYVTTLMGTDILSQPMNGITKNTHAIQHATAETTESNATLQTVSAF